MKIKGKLTSRRSKLYYDQDKQEQGNRDNARNKVDKNKQIC